jgi:hypothetical protein
MVDVQVGIVTASQLARPGRGGTANGVAIGGVFFDTMPSFADQGDTSLLVHLLGLATPCWRCGTSSTPLVAMIDESGDPFGEDLVLCDDERILAFAWHHLPTSARQRFRVGEVKVRASKTAGESYLSNGCSSCGALFGNFPLFHEALPSALSQGFEALTVLASVHLPSRLYNEIYESRWA